VQGLLHEAGMRTATSENPEFTAPIAVPAPDAPARSLTVARAMSVFLPLALGAAALGCAEGQLLPAKSAHAIPDVPGAAAAEDRGVRVSAEANDWKADPADLPDRLTPIKVRIINHSGAPVTIMYQQFALVGAHGRRYSPLPPAPIGEGEEARPVHPVYSASNFFVAPKLHQVYPSLDPWKAPLARDDDFYARQYDRWGKELPTRAMRRMALPEGVLADGGEISGFLYFENATRKESHVMFQADLDQPPKGAEIAAIEIPFVVR
jgi:hypothetical protein